MVCVLGMCVCVCLCVSVCVCVCLCVSVCICVNYPQEVSSMKYCCLGVFGKVVKIRKTSEAILRSQYIPWHLY